VLSFPYANRANCFFGVNLCVAFDSSLQKTVQLKRIKMKELIERWSTILVGVFIPQRMNKRDKIINAILVLIAIGIVVFVAWAINLILGLGRAF
jgi:hypothetical protein